MRTEEIITATWGSERDGSENWLNPDLVPQQYSERKMMIIKSKLTVSSISVFYYTDLDLDLKNSSFVFFVCISYLCGFFTFHKAQNLKLFKKKLFSFTHA